MAWGLVIQAQDETRDKMTRQIILKIILTRWDTRWDTNIRRVGVQKLPHSKAACNSFLPFLDHFSYFLKPFPHLFGLKIGGKMCFGNWSLLFKVCQHPKCGLTPGGGYPKKLNFYKLAVCMYANDGWFVSISLHKAFLLKLVQIFKTELCYF